MKTPTTINAKIWNGPGESGRLSALVKEGLLAEGDVFSCCGRTWKCVLLLRNLDESYGRDLFHVTGDPVEQPVPEAVG